MPVFFYLNEVDFRNEYVLKYLRSRIILSEITDALIKIQTH